MQPFTLLIKPSGSDCNIDCRYCFYKNRPPISPATCGQGLPPAQVRGLNGRQRMSEEVLERLVKDYMELRFPVAGFAWQGGEPTLMGLDFYKRVVELQKKYGVPGQEVGNSLQTNALALVSTARKNCTITTGWTMAVTAPSTESCEPLNDAKSIKSSSIRSLC